MRRPALLIGAWLCRRPGAACSDKRAFSTDPQHCYGVRASATGPRCTQSRSSSEVLHLVIVGLLLSPTFAFAAAPPTFEKDIRPIFKAHCFDCHGEGEKLKGGLDLRLRRLILQGGDDGPVLVPGKPDRSLLFNLVHTGEMPKRDKKLTREQVALIKQWILSGANTARPEPADLGQGAGITEEERAFWSFQPIRQPRIPGTKPKDRARTPVDAFLVDALAKQRLGFSPDAEKITLLRRASLDLIGLPPAPAEIDAFLADTAADAYERLIDRLLDSPHYGERW